MPSQTPAQPTWLAEPSPSARATIIAEVAQAHDGSLGFAHAHIDAAADAGADAVKFQTHIAEAESTPLEPWRKRFAYHDYGPQDDTRFDYWQRMEFTAEQWAGLKRHADDRGLMFLSSPFSLAAYELLERLGVAAWKVASGELASHDMITAMAATGRPVLVSTGMSGWDEIDAAVEIVKRADAPLAVLQCTTAYPSPATAIGLNVIEEIGHRYGCAAGLSDHSATIYPGLAAVTLGAKVIEVHLALSRHMFGPDVEASLTPDDLARLVDGARFIAAMQAHPVDKDAAMAGSAENRRIFFKSLMPVRDLAAGTRLTKDLLTAKKPGAGILADRIDEVVGRRLVRDVAKDTPLSPEDLES